MNTTTLIEKKIVGLILNSAYSSGYTCRLYDGESWATDKNATIKEIMYYLMTTDEETLVIYDESGKRVGSIFLVYGNNGYDVITDNTDNIEINDILSEVFTWIDDNEI